MKDIAIQISMYRFVVFYSYLTFIRMPRKRIPKKKIKKTTQPIITPNEADVRLLSKGFVPNETKFGTPFKGRNKIIIVEGEA
jgi:hypothetical protein